MRSDLARNNKLRKYNNFAISIQNLEKTYVYNYLRIKSCLNVILLTKHFRRIKKVKIVAKTVQKVTCFRIRLVLL